MFKYFMFLLLVVQDFGTIPKVANHIKDDSLYAEIINRSRKPFLDKGKETNAHETTHMINSEYSNFRKRAFYMFPDKIFYLEEFNFKKSDIVKNIPKSIIIKNLNYNTYIIGARDWNDNPSYILNEWVAYINGCSIHVELCLLNKEDKGLINESSGALEFAIYSLALYLTAMEKDPSKLDIKFDEFMSFNLERTEYLLKQNIKRDDIEKKMLKILKENKDLEKIRNLLKEKFNGVLLNV